MSRIKMLLDVIEDVRSLGDSPQALADATNNAVFKIINIHKRIVNFKY